jgi:hypothetical protein
MGNGEWGVGSLFIYLNRNFRKTIVLIAVCRLPIAAKKASHKGGSY